MLLCCMSPARFPGFSSSSLQACSAFLLSTFLPWVSLWIAPERVSSSVLLSHQHSCLSLAYLGLSLRLVSPQVVRVFSRQGLKEIRTNQSAKIVIHKWRKPYFWSMTSSSCDLSRSIQHVDGGKGRSSRFLRSKINSYSNLLKR